MIAPAGLMPIGVMFEGKVPWGKGPVPASGASIWVKVPLAARTYP